MCEIAFLCPIWAICLFWATIFLCVSMNLVLLCTHKQYGYLILLFISGNIVIKLKSKRLWR